jgi:hypothetical protein
MEAVLAKILLALPVVGNKTTYPDFVATLSYQEQMQMPKAISLGKSQGVLKSYISWDSVAKKSTHVLERA